MVLLLLAAAVSSVVPLVLYFGQGAGRSPKWGLVPDGEALLGPSTYRQKKVTRWKRASAPPIVCAAALSCFYLGQMVVPGGFLALAGLAFVFEPPSPPPLWPLLELSAPSGLCVATLLLSAGWTMLEGDPTAAETARRAARWAVVHNLALFGALGVAAAADPSEARMCLAPAIYALASIGQALLVRRAAAAIEAHDAAQRTLPSPRESDLVALAGWAGALDTTPEATHLR